MGVLDGLVSAVRNVFAPAQAAAAPPPPQPAPPPAPQPPAPAPPPPSSAPLAAYNLSSINTDLQKFEAVRTHAYVDSRGYLTIGIGHKLPAGSDPNTVWPLEQCFAVLDIDIDSHIRDLDADPLTAPWWRTMDGPRCEALIELAFNMGEHTLDEFKHMLGFMADGQFESAAAAAQASDWYGEVNGDGRGDFVCGLIRTGVRA